MCVSVGYEDPMNTSHPEHPGKDGTRCWFVSFLIVLWILICAQFNVHSENAPLDKTSSIPLSIELSETQLVFSWSNESALGYQLYQKKNLNQSEWTKVMDFEPGKESTQTYQIDLPSNQSAIFYFMEKIPDPLASLLTMQLSEEVTMEFVSIPSGSFSMGSPREEQHRENNESPLTQVSLSKRFLIGKHEVTQAQWNAVMDRNPSRFKANELPVERVSWFDALEFCEKLTDRERQAGRLPEGYAYTLPTEAQWEYACRSQSQTRFYYGDDPDYSDLGNYAWYWTNSSSKTHPTGSKEPNPFGLYDMHGNVWEWCLDIYSGSHPGGEVIDPRGPQSGAVRVIRGGGWEDFARDLRSACRLRMWPGNSFSYLGFRLALSQSDSG